MSPVRRQSILLHHTIDIFPEHVSDQNRINRPAIEALIERNVFLRPSKLLISAKISQFCSGLGQIQETALRKFQGSLDMYLVSVRFGTVPSWNFLKG